MSAKTIEATASTPGIADGDTAEELAGAVLAGVGGELLSFRVRQVDHQPAAGTTATYAARVRWADESVTDELLGAVDGALPDGVARLSDGQTEVGMWRFPYDPELPALPAACDPERMRRLAASLGLGDGPVTTRVRSYRPRRRAVVEVRSGGRAVFVKVLRGTAKGEHRAHALHERHRLARAAGCPVPESLGWTDDGLVVLAAMPGNTLRQVLTAGQPGELDIDEVPRMLATLPAELAEFGRRRTWGQRAAHYAAILGSIVPEFAGRAGKVATAVDHDRPEGPDVAVHGDFYESQLLVHQGSISGLLDIDTAGKGERLDDAGCLLGHLSVLAQIHLDHAPVIDRLCARLRARFQRELCPAALDRRAAAVVLSLATGPHRVQEAEWQTKTGQRIGLAERWLECAGRDWPVGHQRP
ncbi:phosphotransferase family enzyme [Tamaricihabitans halophyticus]|uniref:Phosphotransferase family enzyme n=1 Tax=Tamaricihabitans halophyticus TaxID=1262583 RepID=A0A4R2QFL4_9PSEU|nr:phosphotransferase [Tamaricihabitans halophyticus]TCP47933.1 phosphotransferase family enzyme [Tamaricihabitans halophyticus]